MTLNRDLFGDLIPERPQTVPVSIKPRKQTDRGKMGVSHGSILPSEEFMKAPLLHVGTEEQAAHIVDPDWRDHLVDPAYGHEIDNEYGDEPLYDSAGDVEGVHSLQISKHAKIYPVTFPDDIANEAHLHFMRDMGIHAGSAVNSTRSFHGREHPLVARALDALKSNKIVRYRNDFETPDNDWSSYGRVEDAIAESYSYIVPSPSLNLFQFGEKDPQDQPMLPMDYTGILPESKKTKKEREIKKRFPWASETSIQEGRYDDAES